jgi:hypothetical protein
MSDRGEKFDWEGAEDITALSVKELRERLEGRELQAAGAAGEDRPDSGGAREAGRHYPLA